MINFKSIKAKMLAYFFSLFIILLISFVIFYQMAVSALYRVATDSVEKTIQQINKDTYKVLSEATRIADNVSRDGEIQVQLRNPLPDSQQEMYKQRMNYNYNLNFKNQYTVDIDGIYVLGRNGAIFRSSKGTLRKQEFREEEWFKQVIETREELWLAPHPGSDIIQNLDYLTISVVYPVKDRISSRILGVVVVDVRAESLNKIEDNGLVFEGKSYILDEDDKVIYSDQSNDEEEIDAVNHAFHENQADHTGTADKIEIGGKACLYSSMYLSNNGWKTVGIISDRQVFAPFERLRMAIIFAILVFGIIAVIFAWKGADNVSEPIKKVRTTMKQVEKGDFNVQLKIASQDEVGELAQSFNHMIEKIKRLMAQEQESQEKLRYAELKALQSQINPHFLYNTLDSINWMVRMGRNDKVEEMIDALSTFFRISLSKGRHFISIREELIHVEKYIMIQKVRYERIMESEICVPEEFFGYDIIKMTLQPLVENALYHGIKEKGEGGVIRITAEGQGDNIVFCVSDTGLGMSKEKLEKLQIMMDQGIDHDPDAYGIINVQKRIHMYFGTEYGLRFESEPGSGTSVYVTIPKRIGGKG
ncbi:MAG: sensor histidine kinase [Lachnospiraceae bacterium]|nr:sensor histidine kinase [Lachnospiraceae bacterium]